MPVARRIVEVTAAAHVNASSESMHASCGAIGEGGTCGSGNTMCSPAQSDSKPASSAVRATAAMRSGWALAPMLMLKSPSFTNSACPTPATDARSGAARS